ncbi:MAG: Gfo/Idh/MocA family oxidoreductase [Bacteroidales bacterium]|nr:Gfo/Idh/MocA family oxidoreductase [Bacteroidales bacterium]
MQKSLLRLLTFLFIGPLLLSCSNKSDKEMASRDKLTMVVLNPGHFHAALVQKQMYPMIDSTVYVYAPAGMELNDYLKRIDAYNSRVENPTHWNIRVYTGEDFFEKMLAEEHGDLVVLAGNNMNKTEYILSCIKAGMHVLSDKPMAIDTADYELLRQAFDIAKRNHVLLYDIMTERFEITTMLQKALSEQASIFGELQQGSFEEPAITKESVHHFFKYVSGTPLQRPAWFFDITQQGEAIADVGTHLVDLILWEAFPDEKLPVTDSVEFISSRRWTTDLLPTQFRQVTGMETYPGYMAPCISGDTLKVPSNNALNLVIDGIHAKVSVEWKFRAPDGAGDTHYSIMQGTISDLVIQQGPEQNYKPELYIHLKDPSLEEIFSVNLQVYYKEVLNEKYPGIAMETLGEGVWRLNIPNKYRSGHEAHFSQVMNRFLKYLESGELPEWEIEQMLVKYFITTTAVK